MQVIVKPKAPGTHRVEYVFTSRGWAFPLFVAVNLSLYPTAESGFDVSRWTVQRVLVIHVLCMRMQVVISGPLFDDEVDE